MTARLLAIDVPLARTAYPEREDRRRSAIDARARAWIGHLPLRWAMPVSLELRALTSALERQGDSLQSLDDHALRRRLERLATPAVHGLRRDALHAALTCVAELARRTLGMRPYPTQLLGAAVLLRGRLAEMQTGEGKTLTAGLAACLAGAAGVSVHVVTVNDYLAGRDASKLAPLFAFMGLSVGVVVEGMDTTARRAAYASDIAYCTNKELVFDYLRDRVAIGGRTSAAQMQARSYFAAEVDGATGGTVLRGLHFAIVDEADSVLIDEARTPLILAEKAGAIPHAESLEHALRLAAQLVAGVDFTLDPARRDVRLTPRGDARIAAAGHTEKGTEGEPADGTWQAAHARQHLLTQALCAMHLHVRDQHYLIDADGKVQIIDEYTGRVLTGRVWEQGLHQLIETKEQIALSEQTQTLARITYQRFFPRYLRLSGMTGTAREMATELDEVYGLRTVTIPTHRPSRRQRLPDQICTDATGKWQAVAAQVLAWHGEGRPVLVGTRSVEASEWLSRVLTGHGVPHRLLNARQDDDEATVIAAAGQVGAVTVATNMAGRGTDIELGEGVAARGGLAVILTDYHESPRIDRQLFGRCARQGDPGTAVAIVALDDALFVEQGGAATRWLAGMRHRSGADTAKCASRYANGWVTHCRHRAQARAERMHARTRRETLRRDQDIDRLLAFSGDPL